MNKTLTIPAISCGHCLKTIERELNRGDSIILDPARSTEAIARKKVKAPGQADVRVA